MILEILRTIKGAWSGKPSHLTEVIDREREQIVRNRLKHAGSYNEVSEFPSYNSGADAARIELLVAQAHSNNTDAVKNACTELAAYARSGYSDAISALQEIGHEIHQNQMNNAFEKCK